MNKLINKFSTPETLSFINENSKIRCLIYSDNDLTWIYYGTRRTKTKPEIRYRYILGTFKNYAKPKKILLCFGLNPSVGVPLDLENTVQNLNDIAFSKKYKYDGWVMLNLFPLRNSNSESFLKILMDMDEDKFKACSKKNIKYIKEILSVFSSSKVKILLAWGGTVKSDTTGRLKNCIKNIYDAVKSAEISTKKKFPIYSCYRQGVKNKLIDNIHPRHLYPWRIALRPTPENVEFEQFDFDNYVTNFCCKK